MSTVSKRRLVGIDSYISKDELKKLDKKAASAVESRSGFIRQLVQGAIKT